MRPVILYDGPGSINIILRVNGEKGPTPPVVKKRLCNCGGDTEKACGAIKNSGSGFGVLVKPVSGD
jgi:hypothetical protein